MTTCQTGSLSSLAPAVALMLLTAVSLLSGQTHAQSDNADETFRARIEALALEPRIDATAVADGWFLIRFYERRQFSPAWDSPAKLDALLDALAGSVRHGLDPEDYHLSTLRSWRDRQEAGSDAQTRAAVDALATDALARYAFHLHFGKVNPEALEPTWNFSRSLEGVNPVNAITRLIDADDLAGALESLAPQEERYRQLMQGLARYRALRDAGGWHAVTGGETLRAGMRGPRVAALRARLRVTGDLAEVAANGDDELFDEALDAAVRTFQHRHGLDVDGAVGPRSLAAMNVPVDARIDQLRVNLERVRWIFRDLEPRYLVANIARFRVTLIEDGEPVWSTRAVVGRPYRQTPVFRARMTYLVLNPTWTVPPGILRNDILPEVRRDIETLARRNMSVLDMSGRRVEPLAVDWSGAAGFPYMVRQEPGPDNALGRVKFMFPNRYHVYMHDTPARELFERSDRTFSSGCIRLENPMELVDLLLGESRDWNRDAVDRVLATGRERTVNLPRPITVLMVYATALPEDGQLHFLPDVYNRDARLLGALEADFDFVPPAGWEEALLSHER